MNAMKIFLDTADLTEIRRAADAGLIDGVTTNPSLMAKVAGGKDAKEIFREIAEIVDGPVSAEVVALDAETMISEGKRLAELHPNIVIKVPLTEDGLKACRAFRNEDIGVNVTLCFSPLQALLAAKAGATFISPFVGRLDDIAHDGMDLISQIRQIYDNYGMETEILVASVRHPQHLVESALMGADCATIPPKVLWQMAKHPLTDKGLEGFMKDWESLGQEL
jgi:transaldolase